MTDNTDYYIHLFKNDAQKLINVADEKCREIHGDSVYVRGLIEFTNICAMDCAYCGIRNSNTDLTRYRMSSEEIISAAKKGYEKGIKTFVLQGGEDGHFSDDTLVEIIDGIKNATNGDAALTLSVGIRSRKSYAKLKDAGADRYLLRFETSDPEIYAGLKNGQSLHTRLNAIREIRELDFETGSGYMTGLPGETEDTVIKNALLCRELGLDMVGIGPFIPHEKTPLKNAAGSSIELAVKAVALTRLLLPQAHMPATTAAGTIHPQGREMMLKAGANVVMPNITPEKFKKDYLLYPGKICLDEDFVKCLGCLGAKANYCGKKIDLGVAGAERKRAK